MQSVTWVYDCVRYDLCAHKQFYLFSIVLSNDIISIILNLHGKYSKYKYVPNFENYTDDGMIYEFR